MKHERLVKMANSIGTFFSSEPEEAVAIESIKDHIQKTWDKRMRDELIVYNKTDGLNLNKLVRQAVIRLDLEN